MKSLKAFLNPVQNDNEMVVVSKRFMEDGKPVQWEIKSITSAENDILMKKYMKKNKKGGQDFDRISYMNELVASAVVFPDLQNADLQKAYGVMGQNQLLSKMLLVGEFATLSEAVQKISGLDTEEETLIQEVKN